MRGILTEACRVADVVAELDEAANEAPLTARSSQKAAPSGRFQLPCLACRSAEKCFGFLGDPAVDRQPKRPLISLLGLFRRHHNGDVHAEWLTTN